MSSDKIEKLTPYRQKINALDDQIIDLLGQRLDIIRAVAVLKAQDGIEPVLQDRVDEVRNRCIARAKQYGYDETVIAEIYSALIEYSCQVEQAFQEQTFAHKEND